ncbi:MAG: CotH kinase family protein [Lachnospiraceae bacterium]|nr:CotH kinase family protein [Lachnospiraceae bacterium]
MGMLFLMTGCAAGGRREQEAAAMEKSEAESEQKIEKEMEKQVDEAIPIRDQDSLYEKQDRASVVTMYLTVTPGNASDHTDHTWEEVNRYSAYDYKEMGVERYAVNGLLQVGDENGPVEGELGYGQEIPNATVTIRGQTSTRYEQKNYRIALRDEKGTWNDQKVINLNKHQQDPVRFTNKLCFDLMTELPDMMSLRTQFVHLYVKDMTGGGNGRFQDYGLYTQVEQLNGRALQSHGLDKNGQLYKVNFFEFYRYEDIIMLKSDADYRQEAFEELLEIKGNDDHSKLIAMLEDVNDYSIPIEDVIEEWFEKENLFSWMAFHILVGNVDTQSRNTFLYSPLNSKTWYFLSWDNDVAFSDTKRIFDEGEEQVGWEKGISNYWGNILFQRILKSKSLRAELDEKIQEYRACLTPEKLESMITEYAPVIEAYAFRYPDSEHMPVTKRVYQQMLEELPGEIERNYELYQENLEEPMPFYIGTPVPKKDGIHFEWDNAYEFQEENVWYTLELADDYSFEKPFVTEEGIFTPEYVYRDELKPGQYFVRIKATNESGKEQYAFDYYVSNRSEKNFGIKCFFVLEDGRIVEDVYEE